MSGLLLRQQALLAALRRDNRLLPGTDIHIIACSRRESTHDGRVIGIRWGSRPDLGFPDSGYRIAAVIRDWEGNENVRTEFGPFWLPPSDTWTNFEAEARNRRPVGGPYFPARDITETNFGYLLPLIRLADPRTAESEYDALTESVSGFFGATHAHDAELAWHLWPGGSPAPLDQLLLDANARDLLHAYYRGQASDFLCGLAIRFEYAALFGLGTNEAWGGDDRMYYRVAARWRAAPQEPAHGVASSDPERVYGYCTPAAPRDFAAVREPGSVGHPAFVAVTAWEFPESLRPPDQNGNRVTSDALTPRVPAAFTALAWSAPPAEPNVIGYGPVLYDVERFAHGPATAQQLLVPPLPAAASFVPLLEGEQRLWSPGGRQALDLPGMPWPPLEGYYHYRIRGVDLLGNLGQAATLTSLRHHDDFTPPAPRLRAAGPTSLTFVDPGVPLEIPVEITWESPEDFNGADVEEFRFAVSWTRSETTAVTITAVRELDALRVELSLDDLAGPDDRLAGARLSAPGGDYPVESHGSGVGATMVVRKAGGRQPGPGAAAVTALGAASRITRIATVPRAARVDLAIGRVEDTDPLRVAFTVFGGGSLPAGGVIRIYLHLFRGMVEARHHGGRVWEVVRPATGAPLRSVWDAWAALPDPAATALGSPAIYYPPQAATISIPPDAGLVAGILKLSASAADATGYVASPRLAAASASLENLTGNESARSELIYSVRSTAPPLRAGVAPWSPSRREWASSAAAYAEDATHEVRWTGAAGAARYEVWRVLEGALSGVTPATSDAELRSRAGTQLGSFQLRSEQVFGTSYLDRLPGRAPTRALYYVKTVSLAGERSEPSAVIGPVWVPDVRAPLKSNLLRAGAAPSAEATDSVKLSFTQPGPLDGVRWEISARPADDPGQAFAPIGVVTAGSAPDAAGRYTFIHGPPTPGKRFEYRVRAVRDALDPIDATGALTRSIAGAWSETLRAAAFASGPLLAPAAVAASYDVVGGQVLLDWTNPETYEAIELRRKDPGGLYFRTIARLAGDAVSYSDAELTPGFREYELRALGVNRLATTTVQCEVATA